MLGDGIVSFGVCSGAATDRRYANASPKIVSDSPIRPSTCSDGGANSSVPGRVAELHVQRLVDDLRDAVERVDEVHVPRRAAELPVGDGPQPDVVAAGARRRAIAASSTARSSSASIAPPAKRSRASQQLGRAQQAADVVGAERRSVAQAHGAPRSGSSASTRWATAKAALAAGTPQ